METKLSSSKILIPLDLKTFFAESAPIRGCRTIDSLVGRTFHLKEE